MEVTDYNGLLKLINETLIHLCGGGDPSEAPLVLPRFDKAPTCSQQVPGYDDSDVFNPETLGAAFVVSKGTSDVAKTCNLNAKWILNPGGGKNRWDTDVLGLRQTHCTCKPCKGQSKTQFEFTPYKFELVDFLDKASGLYMVVNMQRQTPKADTEEHAEAAMCYSPPAVERRREDREVEGAVAKTPMVTPPSSYEDAGMAKLIREITLSLKQRLQDEKKRNEEEMDLAERRVSDMMQQLTESCAEAQQHLAAEREGRARAEAAARQATDRAQAAEVLHPVPCLGFGAPRSVSVLTPEKLASGS